MSASRHTPKERSKTREKFLAKIESGEIQARKKSEITEVTAIPRWVKTALGFVEVAGLTMKEAAERVGRRPATLGDWCAAPAVKEWRAQLRKTADDPVALGQGIVRSMQGAFTLEYMALLDAAINAHDRDLAEKMLAKLMESEGTLRKPKSSDHHGPSAIVINLGSSSVEIPMIESSHKPISAPTVDAEIISD